MAGKSPLNSGLIKQIAEFVKLRMSWTQIARAIGVTDRTIQNWRNQGMADRKTYKTGRRTLNHELVDAIDKAKSEMIGEYAAVVRNEALNGKVTVTTREYTRADGTTAKDTITKTEPPNAALADKILQREDPANWAEIKHVTIDWQKQVSAQGQDPDALKEKVGAFIAGATDDDDEPDTD